MMAQNYACIRPAQEADLARIAEMEIFNYRLNFYPIFLEDAFYFAELQKAASHKFGDEAEAVFAQMNISGGKTWQDLVSYMSASVEVDYKGGKTTLSAKGPKALHSK